MLSVFILQTIQNIVRSTHQKKAPAQVYIHVHIDTVIHTIV